MFSLDGKVALVTGMGSSGTGWANGQSIATLFARQGARVYGVDRDIDAAERTAEIIRAEAGHITTGACDVTDADAVRQCVDAALPSMAESMCWSIMSVNPNPGDRSNSHRKTGVNSCRRILTARTTAAIGCCR